ncbi:MAG: site-specific integrase [Desulfovibrio sp.]|nr:site-specific integrase [Desulfovibrio sp.]MBI4958698.1 site-specific integrase [Desulfovibrio sp.]
MAIQWIKCKSKGVRYREHSTRRYLRKPDRYYTIFYKFNCKFHQEAVGWASEGHTESEAEILFQKLKTNRNIGEGPQTLKQAKQLKIDQDEQTAANKMLESKKALTFGKFFIATYAPHSLTTKTKKSTDREDQLFRLWISPVIGDLPFKNISALHLNQIMSNMLAKDIAPRSVNYAFAVIRQVFNYAKFCHVSEIDSPTQTTKMLKFDNQRRRFLTKEEASMLLKALKDKSDQVYAISLISFECGLRASEIFSLKWGDVSFENEQMMIWDSKNTKSRPAFMTENIKKLLMSFERGGRGDLIFPGREGVKINQISQTFRKVVESLGLNDGVSDPRQKVVFHTLRHTFASWLAQGDTNIYTVKELMGHSNLAMTQRYAHLGNGALKKAIKKLDGKIDITKLD